MGLGISWKKAAIISAVVHLIALFIAVIFFVVVPAIQDMETYEIDLTQSVLDDGGSGHAGGGGGNRSDLFPKPLSADEVAARTKAVVANIDPSPATDIPDAVDVAAKASENKGNTSGDNSAVGGTGPGSGGGSGGGWYRVLPCRCHVGFSAALQFRENHQRRARERSACFGRQRR